jgi:gliding motility-associated-like protein
VNPTGVEFNADTGWIKVYLKTTTEYGCWDTTSRDVKVEPDITVFTPNAFRPGSSVPCPEGEPQCNEVFKIAANGYATIEIIVYNRWGQEVFRTNDANIGWNGCVNNKLGQECPQDVYIYQIYATSYNGKSYKYSGSVTLIR